MGDVIGGKFNRTPQFPWSPIDDADQEFWCERLGIYCFLEPEVLYNGARSTYHVKQSGTSVGARVYPVFSEEIIPSQNKAAKKIDTEKGNLMFPINRSNYDQIRNFLADDFVPSYQWVSTEDKTADEVRKLMLSRVKAPRNGFARDIEDERMQGFFLDKSTFAQRMKIRSDSFPWETVANFLEFSTPIT
jgi:hypothetical protein